MRVFIFVLLLSYAPCLPAQTNLPAYIVISDTIKGEIRNFNTEKQPAKIEFRSNDGFKTYTPAEIKAFGIPSEQLHYKTATITYHPDPIDYRLAKDEYSERTENATVFLKQLVQGKLKLYQFNTPQRVYFFAEENGVADELVYRIKLANGQLARDEQFKNQLNGYAARHNKINELGSLISNTAYTATDLTKIFLKLNDQSAGLARKKKTAPVYLFGGAAVCAFTSQGNPHFIPGQGLSHITRAEFKSTISPSIGVEANFTRSRLAFVGGLGYQYLSYDGNVKNTLEYRMQQYTSRLHLVTPSLRVQFLFNPNAPVKFFAGGLGTYPLIVNHKNGAVTVSTYESNGQVIKAKGEPSLKSGFLSYGGYAGAVTGKIKIDLSVSQSGNMIDEGENRLRFLSIGLRLHYLISGTP